MSFNMKSWSDRFYRAPKRLMTETEVGALMAFYSDTEVPDEIKQDFGFKLISSRAEHIGLHLTDCLKVLLMVITECNPGSIVMYLYAIRSRTESCSQHQFCAELFPNGFLTSKAMEECWMTQKVGGANGLDMHSFEDEKND